MVSVDVKHYVCLLNVKMVEVQKEAKQNKQTKTNKNVGVGARKGGCVYRKEGDAGSDQRQEGEEWCSMVSKYAKVVSCTLRASLSGTFLQGRMS